jgi:ParB/RepB/Spo0J family partition protein
MTIAPYCSIIIPPNRQRRTFSEKSILELADSIYRLGLLHPPVVRALPDGTYTLVAGERRLRALGHVAARLVNEGKLAEPEDYYIPVTLLSDLSETERFEAELHENILREDLPWAEKSAAIARLHALRTAQNPGQTQSATASELSQASGRAIETSRDDLRRALVIERAGSNPKVLAARNAQEAYKIATAELRAEFTADLNALVRSAPSPHTLIEGDCRAWMAEAEAGKFDLILSDPPYGMDASNFGDAGPRHGYKDDYASAMDICATILCEGYRVCKSAAHLYLFCDIDNFHHLRDLAEKYGWYAWRTPLIWYKGAGQGHNPIPEIGFRRSYEMLLYAVKGNRSATKLMADVLEDKRARSSPEHPAAKPVWVYEDLITRSCLPGDSVLDPCAGTGTIFSAANACNVRATGVEIDPAFITLCKGRM